MCVWRIGTFISPSLKHIYIHMVPQHSAVTLKGKALHKIKDITINLIGILLNVIMQSTPYSLKKPSPRIDKNNSNSDCQSTECRVCSFHSNIPVQEYINTSIILSF
jgi:hypothetical protein